MFVVTVVELDKHDIEFAKRVGISDEDIIDELQVQAHLKATLADSKLVNDEISQQVLEILDPLSETDLIKNL